MTERPLASPSPPIGDGSQALRLAREAFSRQGLMGTLGAWLVEAGSGRAVVELPYATRLSDAGGHFHAAVVTALAEACAASAASTLVAQGAAIVPARLVTTFTGPAEGRLLRARAESAAEAQADIAVQVELTCLKDDAEVACGTASLAVMVRPVAA